MFVRKPWSCRSTDRDQLEWDTFCCTTSPISLALLLHHHFLVVLSIRMQVKYLLLLYCFYLLIYKRCKTERELHGAHFFAVGC